MAKFKLKVLLKKKYTLKIYKVNAKNEVPYNCQSTTVHVPYQYLTALNTPTKRDAKITLV